MVGTRAPRGVESEIKHAGSDHCYYDEREGIAGLLRRKRLSIDGRFRRRLGKVSCFWMIFRMIYQFGSNMFVLFNVF